MELTPYKPTNQLSIVVPWHQIPAAKSHVSRERGTHNNLLLAAWGGIGDEICAEPTVRYAVENFKDCQITVATYHPELFSHLKLKDTYDLRKERPIEDDYLILHTIPIQNLSIAHQFYSHMHMNCVDFPAISALRMQLPEADRQVAIRPTGISDKGLYDKLASHPSHRYVAVHAGRHWESKTFPKDWWDAVIRDLLANEFIPILIGKHEDESQGYVDVDPTGCLDLRDKTSIMESMWIVQHVKWVICNDSSPLHMAAPGEAFIAFIASVKRPEFITHWRRGGFGWRMQNFSVGGLWDHVSMCPNRTDDLNMDKVDPKLVEALLPDPKVFAAHFRRIDGTF